MAVCLCVDYRFRTEFARVATLLKERHTSVTPWIDGKGKVLSPRMYSQISPTPPANWMLGAGAYAHFHGMKNIIRKAKAAGARHLLFVEDDLIFTEDADRVLENALDQLSFDVDDNNWDILYYGANHSEAVTENLSTNVIRVYGSYTTHCLGIKASIFDAILDLPENHVIDNMIARTLHHSYRCLAVWPSIALQKPGHSYLWGKQSDYTELFQNKGRNS